MVTAQDKQHIINCLVKTIYAFEPTDPEMPEKVQIELEDGSKLTFKKAHWILRGYKGEVPGVGFIQILEQNPAKTGSWCGILVNKYKFNICWLWTNGNYNRCLVYFDGDYDVLFFDATGGASATRDEVKNHPRIKAIIDEMDGNREQFLKADKSVKHFE